MTTEPIDLGNWQNLDIHTATNLYLYGTIGTPSEYSDRLRSLQEYNALPLVGEPPTPQLKINLDAVSYMETGPGQHAHVSDIQFVKDFYAGNISLPPGSYTRDELIDLHGYKLDEDFSATYSQYQIDVNSLDYAQRAYVFNTTSFAVSGDTTFVINPDGSRSISQVALLPVDDNFDFVSTGVIGPIGNELVLKPQIDPYGIGRTLDIQFTDTSKNLIERITNYDYEQDKINAANVPTTNSLLAIPHLSDAMFQVVNELKTSGTIEYISENGSWIIYGSAEGDTLYGTGMADIIVSGEGDDIIHAGQGDDIISGSGGGDLYMYMPYSSPNKSFTGITKSY